MPWIVYFYENKEDASIRHLGLFFEFIDQIIS